jgi:hypothetical protein
MDMAKTAREKTEGRKAPAKRRITIAPPVVSDDMIAQRAFEMYCARGGGDGQALEDWLQAERELRPQTETVS